MTIHEQLGRRVREWRWWVFLVPGLLLFLLDELSRLLSTGFDKLSGMCYRALNRLDEWRSR